MANMVYLMVIALAVSVASWGVLPIAAFMIPPKRQTKSSAFAGQQACLVLFSKKEWTTTLFPVSPSVRKTTTTSTTSTSTTTGTGASSATVTGTAAPTTTITKQVVPPPRDTSFASQAACQWFAGSIGALTGFGIAAFKLSIKAIRDYAYDTGGAAASNSQNYGNHHDFLEITFLVPVLGGVAVAVLAWLGGGDFPPGVRGIVEKADEDSLWKMNMKGSNDGTALQQYFYDNKDRMDWMDATAATTIATDTNSRTQRTLVEFSNSVRKALAAVFTLGTGCSLGPEGPGVEIGIAVSRFGSLLWPRWLDETTTDDIRSLSTTRFLSLEDNENTMSTVQETELQLQQFINTQARLVQRNRLFLACGAAAGVSSGFNAPLAGVFFALEVIQKNLPSIDITIPVNNDFTAANSTPTDYSYELQQESLSTEAGSITAILTSSVVSALVIRILLGNELSLRILEYEIPTPLRELPIYLMLGAMSGLTAVIFSQTTKFAKAGFDGEMGPPSVRDTMDSIPDFGKPILGGLTCGVVGHYFPNILFFGYETLNGLLENNQIDTGVALALLGAKIFATAICAASGLVGGTLAPSLFMGGMVGVSFHNFVVETVDISFLDFSTKAFGGAFQIADLPAYTMVGAASFLAAVFRAPLTASLLAFELTKDYDVLVPLLASAGFGTLFCDLIENRIDQKMSSLNR